MTGITPNHIWHEDAIKEVRRLAQNKRRDAEVYRLAAEDKTNNADIRRRWMETAQDMLLVAKSVQEMADAAARQRCLIFTRWILRAGERGDVTEEQLELLLTTIEAYGAKILDEQRKLDDTEVAVVMAAYTDPEDGSARWAVFYEGAKRSVTDHASLFDAQTRADELLAALEALA